MPVKYDSQAWFTHIMHKEFRKKYPGLQKQAAKDAELVERVMKGYSLMVAAERTSGRLRKTT